MKEFLLIGMILQNLILIARWVLAKIYVHLNNKQEKIDLKKASPDLEVLLKQSIIFEQLAEDRYKTLKIYSIINIIIITIYFIYSHI